MKKILIAWCLVVLAGCESGAREYHPEVLPEGLKDCKFYSIADRGNYMRVVRCPNSDTSLAYKNGKATMHTFTEDSDRVQ